MILKEFLAGAKRYPGGLLIDGLPPIGVPSKRPPIVVREPEALIRWLFFRGMANRQLGRIVECAYCGKWGLRNRARQGMKYCTKQCQQDAHLEGVKRSQNSSIEFAALETSGRRAVRLKQINDRKRQLENAGGALPKALRREKEILDYSERMRTS